MSDLDSIVTTHAVRPGASGPTRREVPLVLALAAERQRSSSRRHAHLSKGSHDSSQEDAIFAAQQSTSGRAGPWTRDADAHVLLRAGPSRRSSQRELSACARASALWHALVQANVSSLQPLRPRRDANSPGLFY